MLQCRAIVSLERAGGFYENGIAKNIWIRKKSTTRIARSTGEERIFHPR
jgi:hypothetical protein